MPGTVDFSIRGMQELVNSLLKMSDSVNDEMMRAMDDAGSQVEVIMKDNVPYRTGSLASSIGHETESQGKQVVVRIGPNDDDFDGRPVGRATELGRTPGGGFPNWNEIADRYGVSLGVAYAIAKKIHRDGSTGLGYGQKTITAVQPILYNQGIEAMMRIAGRFK